MKLLEESIDYCENSIHTYYEVKITNRVRGNNGIIIPDDAIFNRINVDVTKYKHHKVCIKLWRNDSKKAIKEGKFWM